MVMNSPIFRDISPRYQSKVNRRFGRISLIVNSVILVSYLACSSNLNTKIDFQHITRRHISEYQQFILKLRRNYIEYVY